MFRPSICIKFRTKDPKTSQKTQNGRNIFRQEKKGIDVSKFSIRKLLTTSFRHSQDCIALIFLILLDLQPPPPQRPKFALMKKLFCWFICFRFYIIYASFIICQCRVIEYLYCTYMTLEEFLSSYDSTKEQRRASATYYAHGILFRDYAPKMQHATRTYIHK